MSESEIDEFIAVTQGTRRAAHYYLQRYRNLNDAVLNYMDRGERGVPSDFHYESENESSDDDAEPLLPNDPPAEDLTVPDPTPKQEEEEKEIKGFIALQDVDEMDNENNIENQIIDSKVKTNEGSKLSYLLENVKENPQIKKPVQKPKIEPLPIREISCVSTVFVLWKDGISIGKNFIKKEGEDYENLMKHVRVGQLPQSINIENHIDDFQLVDMSTKPYEEVDLNSILLTC